MQTLLQDLRYGTRMLRKQPGFTLLAVLTLALGIGANTAIFSVVNAALLRPLPYEQAEQLVMVYAHTKSEVRDAVSWPELRDWQAQNQSFAQLAVFEPQSVNLTGRAEPARVIGGFVTANFFDLLRVKPALGRALRKGKDEAGAEPVAIVSQVAWRDRFGADPHLIGQTVTLNGQLFTVVGIMPEGFQAPYSDIEIWLPIQTHPSFSPERKAANLSVLGRLKPGVTLTEAQAEMATIAAGLSQQYPETNSGRGVNLIALHDLLVEGVRRNLMILFAAVGFVLLIACANVANLMLGRMVTRQREMALRAALGASRSRIVRQILTESLMLSLAGGALGLLLGKWGMDALAASSAVNLPSGATVKLDAYVFGFTFGLALLTGAFFGLLPALRLSRTDLNSTLKEGGNAAGGGARGKRMQDALVVAQLALALMLLVGAGLMMQTFVNLLRIHPGFEADNLLTLEYRVPHHKYPTATQQWRFHEQVAANVRTLPGVESAATIFTLPHGAISGATTFALPDRAAPPADQLPKALANRADQHYFQAMGIPLLKGRVFTAQDQLNTPPVIVINQTMARRFWPGEEAVGQRVQVDSPKLTATVIGVVADVKQNSLDELEQPQLYLSFAQNPHIFASMVVRTKGDALSFANAVRGAIWAVDKNQPMWKVRTMEWLLARSISSRRLIMQLLAALSLLALTLAAIGIYGVLSYRVSQQTRDIGVRLALGAQPRNILQLILKHGLALALVGICVGIAGALAITRLLRGVLYGVTATDPVTFGVIAVGLLLIALLACWIPARRATKVDPMIALRND